MAAVIPRDDDALPRPAGTPGAGATDAPIAGDAAGGGHAPAIADAPDATDALGTADAPATGHAPGTADAAGGAAASGAHAGSSGPGAPGAAVADPGINEVVVDVLDSHGRVHSRQRIALDARRRISIGRGAQAQVIIDDAHAAALHAGDDVAPDGTLTVTDLGSVNGVFVGGKRHTGARDLPLPGGLLQIGRTRLRLRTRLETIAPEQPDHALRAHTGHAAPRSVWAAAAAGALVCAAYVFYSSWMGAPRDLASAFAGSMMSVVTGLSAWIALWALLSRLLLGEWRWVTHAAIVLGLAALLLGIDFAFDVAWFSLDLPPSGLREMGLLVLACALLLYGHLTRATSISTRRAALIAVLLPLLATGTLQWVQARNQMRNVNYTGEQKLLLPPALRLRGGASLDDFFRRAATLKDEADRKRRAMPNDELGGSADDEDDSDD